MSTLEHAKLFASEAHKSQSYGSGGYTEHLYDVEKVLRRFGFTQEELIIAAWLHDVVEDTPTTIDQIKSDFGDGVAALVYAVTNEAGVNRAARHAATYHKIKTTPNAIILKLADRIANVEACIRYRDSRFKMYKKEWEGFKEALYTPGQHEDMWNHLASLLEK
jgi:(p)ppGpp synthase/HD superfamily hydrolase